MLAFHNDPAIKAEYLARVAAHERADEIEKGFYWEGGKGCAVGCTIHGSDHARYEDALGIPQMLARLEDQLFEGMPNADAKTFPRRFLEAIPVGADLSLVGWKFLAWLVEDTLKTHGTPEVRKGCKDALPVAKDMAKGARVTKGRARAAAAAARAAAYAAADAAARAAAYKRQAEKLLDLMASAPVMEDAR